MIAKGGTDMMQHFEFTPEQRRLCEQMPTAFCAFEHGIAHPLLTSQGMCDLLGLDRAEIQRLFGAADFSPLLAPEDAAKARAFFQEVCADPETEHRAVFRIRAGQKPCWISCNTKTNRQPDGTMLLYLACEDATEWETRRLEQEHAQRRKDSLMERILATTATALFWKDAQRRFVGVNQAFLDYYGFADDSELLGKTDEEVGWHTDPQPYQDDEWQVLREGKGTYRVPGKCMARGENRDIVASKSPMYVDGKIVGLVGSFEDVTNEARQREEIARLNRQLEQKVAEYDMLMEATGVSIAKVCLDGDFTIAWGNAEFYRATGYSEEEYARLFHGKMRLYYQDHPEIHRQLRTALETALAQRRPSFELAILMPRKEGARWKKGVGTFTDFDPVTGRPAFIYAVYADVTGVVDMQEKLRKAEVQAEQDRFLAGENQRLKDIIDNVPSGIGVCHLTDIKTEHIVLNRYFMRMVAKAAGSDGPSRMISVLHPDDVCRCGEDLHRFLAGDGPLDGVYRFMKKDSADYFWVHTEGNLVAQPDGTRIAYFAYTNVDELKKVELALKTSQRIYDEVLRAANIVAWEYDLTTHAVTMSGDEFTKEDYGKFGLTEFIENAPQSLIPYIEPRDVPQFIEMYDQVKAGHDASCEVWYKINSAEQEPRCERITYTVVRDAEGRAAKAYGMGQNITLQKKAEEAYHRELDYLKMLGDDNLVSKGHFNLTRNLVLDYAGVSCAAFVARPGQRYDDACDEFFRNPSVLTKRKPLRDGLSRAGLMCRCREGENRSALRYRRQNDDGTFSWISMQINTHIAPGTDEVECFTYAYDITAAVRGDKVMSLISETVFDYIAVIHVPTGILEFLKKSPELLQTEGNDRSDYTAYCDYVRENFVDNSEKARFSHVTAMATVLKTLNVQSRYTDTYRRTEGGAICCKQLDYLWLDRDAGTILVLRSDVTAAYERDQEQIRKIEKARFEATKANEAKSTFLSGMSHDLRTPLNGIIGFTDIALRQTAVEKKQEYLEKIKSSGELLLALVNDTLELSRIESGKYALEMEHVDSQELGMTVVTALRPAAELKGVRLLAGAEDFPQEVLWADRLKIQKVLLNLLSNAIKFTPEGGTVKAGVQILDPPVNGCNRRIVVEDNGIGMSAEFLKKMYEPFSQERRSETAHTVGTGLGLSIVQRIVQLMGGSIAVESEIGKGTRFTVDLPLQYEETAALKTADSPLAPLAGKQVLLCEDNYVNREIASLLLQEKDVRVDSAEDGEEGLKKFAASAEGYYDAILMDVRMPVMDGYEATSAIRRLNRPDAKIIPILAMTADAFEEDIRKCLEVGMNRHLAKPIRPEELYRALGELFQ